MTKLRVIIAEDHQTVRDGIKLIVNAQPDMEVVSEASDGLEVLARAEEFKPDVVIMDVSMPRLNGLKAAEKLKQSFPEVQIIALTRHKDDGYLRQLLRAGASGYVLKQSPSEELLHAIRATAAGGKYLDPGVAGRVIGSFASNSSTDLRGVAKVQLTDRESEVLRLIAWGYSNKEIAAQLGLSIKTIEVHKANFMRKLHMNSRIDIVRYALLQGWLEDS